jgi:uncharacterized protein (DUF736 family)
VTGPGKPDRLSLRIDDPSFAAPIHALLVPSHDDAHDLVWSRLPPR